MIKVTIISGPTCCGKTAKSIEYALENNAEIISCDSVQVYRGMDIGSAKVADNERSLVRHHLIDVANVSENFDVARYIELAREAMNDIVSRGKNIVVVGGSGFYLKSWFSAVTDSVSIPLDIKEKTAQIETQEGAVGLAKALESVDAYASKFVDMCNPRRTKNALERCLATGKSVEELLRDFENLPCPMGEIERNLILLDCPNDELLEMIKIRTEKMVADGLVSETKLLIEQGIKQNLSARSAIGYRETIEWIENGCQDKSKLVETIVANTVSLTKKQRKFFKNALLKSVK